MSVVYGRGRVAAADILDKPWSCEEEEPAPAPLWGADMRPKVRFRWGLLKGIRHRLLPPHRYYHAVHRRGLLH